MQPENWSEGFGLSPSQSFGKERFKRDIDSITDIDELRKVAHLLLSAWKDQEAACRWIMGHNFDSIPSKDLLTTKNEQT